MQQIELVTGVVKYPVGKVISTQYGERINAVILLTDSQTEVKLWGKTDAEIRPKSFAIAHSAFVKSFSIVENSQEEKVYGRYVRSRPLGNHNGNGS